MESKVDLKKLSDSKKKAVESKAKMIKDAGRSDARKESDKNHEKIMEDLRRKKELSRNQNKAKAQVVNVIQAPKAKNDSINDETKAAKARQDEHRQRLERLSSESLRSLLKKYKITTEAEKKADIVSAIFEYENKL